MPLEHKRPLTSTNVFTTEREEMPNNAVEWALIVILVIVLAMLVTASFTAMYIGIKGVIRNEKAKDKEI